MGSGQGKTMWLRGGGSNRRSDRDRGDVGRENDIGNRKDNNNDGSGKVIESGGGGSEGLRGISRREVMAYKALCLCQFNRGRN